MALRESVSATELGPVDEMDLLWYYGLELPPVPGLGSTFTAMCARLQARNPRTKELPSDDTPWTEVLKCKVAEASSALDGEDQMIAYIDAQRRAGRVRSVLRQLGAEEWAVLEARFARDTVEARLRAQFGDLAGVALLTATATEQMAKRARADKHDSVTGTLVDLVARAKAHDVRGETRREVRKVLDRILAEADTMTANAIQAYVSARTARRG
jgi:hypothetical protein